MIIDTKILHTSRLELQGYSPENMTVLFEHVPKSDVMTLLGHRTEAAYEKERVKQQQGYAAYNRTFLLFTLKLKETNQIIGRCGLHNWNKDHYRAEIGYHIEDEENKQCGFMSEAVEAILYFGFNELKLHRIEALVAKNNIPSLRILQKFGFEQEGVLKEHYLVDGVFEDSVVFGKLNSNAF